MRTRSVVVALAGLLAAAALAVTAGGASANEIAALAVVGSPQGLIGCLTNGIVAIGVPYNTYCFAVQQLTTGDNAGSLSIDAWTCTYYAKSYGPLLWGSAVATSDHVTAPASALQTNGDGSFVLSAALPEMGAVSISGGPS